jgi:4-hydroxybenzoyl-CoA thioesterase
MNLADFSEHLVIRLPHTDAAGVIFYPRIFEIEEELFERWLELGGFSVRAMIDGRLAPTPIVHCEADYRMPLRVGDRVTAALS